ncbi:unnamed protein product [Haemonchus placei]|uniref:FMRFamide neuropeptide n=1 Tax=Haemonchus placei TaxID=6290 RepID=A0A0N4WZZ3_HAEPC|nr:unnamed protein product [Haemonchus placei]
MELNRASHRKDLDSNTRLDGFSGNGHQRAGLGHNQQHIRAQFRRNRMDGFDVADDHQQLPADPNRPDHSDDERTVGVE